MYFIQADGGGLVKIGYAQNVRARLIGLQVGSPIKLSLLGVIQVRDLGAEQELHRRFAIARSHGEWFHPVPELLALITAEAQPLPEPRKPSGPLVDELAVSSRLHSALRRAGITHIEQLREGLAEGHLERVRNIGRGSLEQLRRALETLDELQA